MLAPNDFGSDSPTARVLTALRAKGSRPKRGNGGNWNAHCPAHDDGNPSLRVKTGDDGKVLAHCHVGCSLGAIAQALGMPISDFFVERDRPGPSKREPFNLAELARVKCLPVEHLQGLGWRDAGGHVEIPYPDRNGKVHRTRVRTAVSAKDGTHWKNDGEGQIAYQPDGGAMAYAQERVVIVEGESDTATLLHVGIAALGVPGAGAVRVIDSHHIQDVRKVYVVRETDPTGDRFAQEVPARLQALGYQGQIIELRMPDNAKDPSALWCRDPDRERFIVRMREVMEAAERTRGPIEWVGTSEIFEPLPPVEWLAKGLQLAPGRPGVLGGYGASKKTLSSQALALAIAAGVPAWGHFETKRGVVRHLDYEQGLRATKRRYQRLALGHGIHHDELGDRLQVAAFPPVYLDSEGAEDAYARACEGADLVVIDALRGATPSTDENSSDIRRCLDALSRVSERLGTAFWIIHHAGKPQEGQTDNRTKLRGSSAIFDAGGSVFLAIAGKKKTDPTRVVQTKMPVDAEGAGVDDFLLAVEDVEMAGNPTAGVCVLHRVMEKPDPVAAADTKYEERAQRLLDFIRRNPGASQDTVMAKVAGRESDLRKVLRSLRDERRVSEFKGERGKLTYRVEVRK